MALVGSWLITPLAHATDAGLPSHEPVTAADVVAQWHQEIRPLVAEHCLRCHGPAKAESNLSLRSIQDVLRGGDRGPALDPAEPASSLLAAVLAEDGDPHMPPDSQLEPAIADALAAWARAAAAVDPGEVEAAEAARPTDVAATAEQGYPSAVPAALVIDLEVHAGLGGEVDPAPLCDDETFVRRVYLDLIGRIPTRDERVAFIHDRDSRKRDQLIDRLLDSPDHASHMAEWFDAILMGTGSPRVMRRRQEHGWSDYLTRAFAENRPWDQVARQIVLGRPEAPEEQGAAWYLYERKDDHQRIAEDISRGVFGVQIQCAQCHDHPLVDEIHQSHYWGLVAFFNRGKNTDSPAGPRVAESAIGGFSAFTNLMGQSQPNLLVYLGADVVDEPRPGEGETIEDRDDLYVPADDGGPRVPKFSRRQKFVDEVLTDHPLVARAMVNRLWALMFGRGLVHPVDQLDSLHPPSHPKLLDWVAEDFRRSGYDVRAMLAQMARSTAYQRVSAAEGHQDPSLFATGAVKPLAPEALYRSMLVALEIEVPEAWDPEGPVSEFRQVFSEVLAPESIATPAQALLLTNGPAIHEMVSPERSPLVARLIAESDRNAAIDLTFESVLGRAPAEDERQAASDFLATRDDDAHKGVDLLIWTLLTSAEFRFNH